MLKTIAKLDHVALNAGMTMIVEYFLYRSKRHKNRAITIGQREDLAFVIVNAYWMSDDENQFHSIAQIEEYLEDELEMLRKVEPEEG